MLPRLLLLLTCSVHPTEKAAAPVDDIGPRTLAFRAERAAALQKEDGWLTLVGLFWLKPGDNHFGSASDNDLVFPPPAPAHAGTLRLEGRKVSVVPQSGAGLTFHGKPLEPRTLTSDASGEPDVLRMGRLSFYVIDRQGRMGIRVKDPQAHARTSFHPIPAYPPSAQYRVEARFEPSPAGTTIVVPNVLGTPEPMASPGVLHFRLDGKDLSLTPVVEPGEHELFILFADLTNRDATYGSGRFLHAALPEGKGPVVLDFNQAYNPPCAFTAFATCPIPPPQNRLKVRIEAGEKRYGDH